ncbi:MAG TPA: type VI secretion system-associated protein TagF [Ramlibacter sp.]|nr:type VI secretion system-associated protein TagF [Ramlibacter sp.]
MAVGLYGKMPAHGDFVRRNLPKSFVDPWDSWLAAGVEASRGQMGTAWDDAWRRAPAWRFCLPPGACGPDPVTGVVAPSEDSVGRRFPLTIASVIPGAMAGAGDTPWFEELEAALSAGRIGDLDADAMLGRLREPDAWGEPPEAGWWTSGVPGAAAPMMWALPTLPPAGSFVLLLDPAHAEGA